MSLSVQCPRSYDAEPSQTYSRPEVANAPEVVAAALEAAYTGSGWREPLAALVGHMKADKAAIVREEKCGQTGRILYEVGCTPRDRRRFKAPGYWVAEAGTQEPACDGAGEVYLSLAQRGSGQGRAPASDAAHAPATGTAPELWLTLEGKHGCTTWLVLIRGAEEVGFGESDRARLAEISAHLVRAFEIQNGALRGPAAPLRAPDLLDRFSFGLVFLDSEMRVYDATRPARVLLSHGTDVGIRDGALRGATLAIDAELRRAADNALNGGHDKAVMMIGGAEEVGRRVIVQLMPFTWSDDSPGAQLVAVVLSADGSLEIAPDQLQSAFGLTPAEARLSACLIGGETLDRAAEVLGISVQTARTYVKRVLAKTGIRRQADLTRAVLPMALLYAAFGNPASCGPIGAVAQALARPAHASAFLLDAQPNALRGAEGRSPAALRVAACKPRDHTR